MKNTFKPDGYNSVSPYYIVDGAQQLVELLKKIFDATELRRFDTPDGKIMHIELKLDDSLIMISDSSENYPAHKVMVHVYVPDVHETYRKAIENGCTSVEEPVNKPGDPDIRGSFLDFAGNFWSVGTQQ